MVISGSIGMTSLVRQHQLEFVHFNDCIPIDMPPLSSKAEAKEMVNALVDTSVVKGWQTGSTETLLDEIAAYYPSFIQYAFSRIKAARAVNSQQIEDLFAEIIRPSWDRTFFNQFDDRLKIYDAPLRDLSYTVFTQVANVTDTPIKHKDLNKALSAASLDEVLKILKEDGFLSCRIARDHSETWQCLNT